MKKTTKAVETMAPATDALALGEAVVAVCPEEHDVSAAFACVACVGHALAVLEDLLKLADEATGELAERAAHDLDHGSYRHPKWWKAVQRFRQARQRVVVNARDGR